MLGPRLPLGVRKAHIFPSSDRPSGSRQVQKANKSPARSPCIYQSGGLSSSRPLSTGKPPAGGAGPGCSGGGASRAADTWWERAGPRECSQLPGAAEIYTSSLSARASFGFEVPRLRVAGREASPPGGGFNIPITSSVQLLWEEWKL